MTKDNMQRRALVTGGAGFLGSHLVDLLLSEGSEVVIVDSLLTSRLENLKEASTCSGTYFLRADITKSPMPLLPGKFDEVYHLAGIASPEACLENPISMLVGSSFGTQQALDFAALKNARFLLASSGKVYGHPEKRPGSTKSRKRKADMVVDENDWGYLSTTDERSAYGQAKRFAEALTLAYARKSHRPLLLNTVRIARIFDTYGPRMRLEDSRVIPRLISQALKGRQMKVASLGRHLRSFCYVTDLVRGLVLLMRSSIEEPVNLGGNEPIAIDQLARHIEQEVPESKGYLVEEESFRDSAEIRCPDVGLAATALGWRPEVGLAEGLGDTIADARQQLRERKS